MADRDYQIKISVDAAEMASAGRQGKQALDELGGAARKAGQDVQRSGDASTAAGGKHRQLKEAVRGLTLEFPLLARAAAVAVNPIGGAVAGVIAGFSIWQSRVKALTTLMAGIELPDIERTVGALKKGEQAWLKYSTALKGVQDSYNAVESANDRAVQALDDEIVTAKKRLDVQKQVELAAPGADKVAIEARYADAELSLEQGGDQRREQLRQDRITGLRSSAAAKAERAAGMKVGSAENDADVAKKYAADAADAKENRPGRIAEMADARLVMATEKPNKASLAAYGRLAWKYKTLNLRTQGDFQNIIDMNQAKVSEGDEMVGRSENFQKSLGGRNRMRDERDRLNTEAGKEDAIAGILERQSAPRGQADEFATRGGQLAGVAQALGQAETKKLALAEQLAAQIQQAGQADAAVLKAMQEMLAYTQRLEADKRRIEAQFNAARNQR